MSSTEPLTRALDTDVKATKQSAMKDVEDNHLAGPISTGATSSRERVMSGVKVFAAPPARAHPASSSISISTSTVETTIDAKTSGSRDQAEIDGVAEAGSGSGSGSGDRAGGAAEGEASASAAGIASEPDDAFFTPTLSDVQAYHASVVARSKRLNEAPLLTAKHRDEEKSEREKKKADKWPQTTIRIKFSDGTQIQQVFPSTSAIQPVYTFVREALDPVAREKPFMLWQPPRSQYPEHPIPQPKKTPAQLQQLKNKTHIVPPANYGPVRGSDGANMAGGKGGKETLSDLGLVPQSVLMIKFVEEEMNASGTPAPLLPELIQQIAPLPIVAPADDGQAQQPAKGISKPPPGDKKMPKWLQKGLMKKK